MVLQSRKKYYKITIIYGKCSGLQIVFFFKGRAFLKGGNWDTLQ